MSGFSILDTVEQVLAPKVVGVQQFAEDSQFCNPPEAPMWMADLSFKPLGDIQIGDKLMGWAWPNHVSALVQDGRQEIRQTQSLQWSKRHLTTATVTDIHRHTAPIVRLVLESGREIRCTADHQWYTGNYQPSTGREIHRSPAIGMTMVHLIDPTPELADDSQWDAAWLGGIFDGEGHINKGNKTSALAQLSLSQCSIHNPDIHARIVSVLTGLGIDWSYSNDGQDGDSKFSITGGRQAYVNFLNWIKSTKLKQNCGENPLQGAARMINKDRIVDIIPDGTGEVIGLTTSTGNYVSWGYASKNCNKPLYPRQAVLLKLIFLEEMSGEEEDVLTYWINGGRGGNEITISPNIRERRDFLRENGYKHFREVQLVGGRRSSKGFVTGLSMAKVMWDTLQLGDPGAYYGIDKEKDIYFSCVAGSEAQAKEFQYADLVSTVETCKAFEPYLVKSLETEFRVATNADLRKANAARARGSKIMRDIAKLRGKALAANAGTLRGSATMVYCMDEMAHMIPGESKASADQVYAAADPSLDQFGLDGMAFLNSSPYTKVGMFYECYEANLRPFDPTAPVAFTNPLDMDSDDIAIANGNPRNFCFQYPSWALFQGYRKYSSKYKKKTRGREFGKMITVSPDWNPDERDDDNDELFSLEDRAGIIQARAKEAANPETYKVERRGKFAEVTDAYLNPFMVEQMYRGIPEGFESAPNGDLVRRFRPLPTNHGQGAMNLYKYKFHVDPSSTTAGFGFAIGHIEYFPDPMTGMDSEHVVLDLIKRWDPTSFPGKVIRWKPILDEIMTYASIFRPFEITFDQHQSLEPIQDLQERLSNRNIQCRVFEKFAPQPLDAKILTPTGWSLMGDLVEGDLVIGSNGKPCEILGVYPQGEQEVYRVTFSDGSATECSGDHLWRVMSQTNQEQTLTLQQIMDQGIRYNSGSLRWRVKHVQPVEFGTPPEASMPIDPYLLGSLLGDGCFHKSVWMACAKDDADEQEAMIRPLLPEGVSITRRNRGGWDTLYFCKHPGIYRNPLSDLIRSLGLWYVAGSDKFIPDQYLRASIDDRVALLQGLMDTDGTVSDGTYCVRFDTTSWHLAEGVKDLVGSLGGSVTIRKYPHRKTIQVAIKRLPSGVVPFRLKRKVERYPEQQRSGNYRHMRTVELVGVKETRCIRVNNHDNLYVTDDYILTHNTNELNWKRWEVFKTALYQNLIHAPYDEYPNPSPMGSGTFTSKDELKFLQSIQTGGKFPRIEKQDIGPVQTKDMADCIAEVVHTLIGNLHITSMRDRLSESALVGGAAGGYGIGQNGPIGGPGPPGISGYYSRREEKIAMNGGRSPLTHGALGIARRGRANRSRGRW